MTTAERSRCGAGARHHSDLSGTRKPAADRCEGAHRRPDCARAGRRRQQPRRHRQDRGRARRERRPSPRPAPAGKAWARRRLRRGFQVGADQRLRRHRRDGRRRVSPARAAADTPQCPHRRGRGPGVAVGCRRQGQQLAEIARGPQSGRECLREDRHRVFRFATPPAAIGSTAPRFFDHSTSRRCGRRAIASKSTSRYAVGNTATAWSKCRSRSSSARWAPAR